MKKVFYFLQKGLCDCISVISIMSQMCAPPGADPYYNNIENMIGYRPSAYMKICWKFLTPCVSAVSPLWKEKIQNDLK